MKNDLTTGNVAKTLITFTVPLLLANLLQAFYAVADLIIVGLFSGAHSISAVSTSGQFTHVITMLLYWIHNGCNVDVASTGAKQHEQQHKTIGNVIILSVAVSLIITIVTLLTGKLVLDALNTPPEAYSEAYEYYMICMSGIIFIMGYNSISSILRGKGDSKTPLVMVLIAACLNVVLDLLLVGYFKMGAAGAAYATVAAQAVSMFASLIIIIKRKMFKGFTVKDIRLDGEKIKRLLKIGMPMSVQQTIVSISFLFLTSIINSFGVIQSAAAGIAGKINGFAILPAAAMMVAVSAMSGQNLGAGQPDRAKRTMSTGIKIIMPIIAVIFVIIFTFAHSFIRIFTDEAAVIETGVTFLRICSGEYLILSVVLPERAAYRCGAHNPYIDKLSCSSILLRYRCAIRQGLWALRGCACNYIVAIAFVIFAPFSFIRDSGKVFGF